MRVVQLVNNLEVGGTERLVVDLAAALQSRGHVVSVVCLRAGRALAPHLERVGIEVLTLDKKEGPRPRVLIQLARYLRRERADVVHSHNPLVHHYGLMGGRLAGVPVIVNTIHGLGNISDKVGFKERLYALSCLLSSRVVAVCPMAFRAFSAGGVIPPSRLITINNGIPLAPFIGIERDARTSVDERRGFVFGIVGRLVPVKDHRTLLDAFAEVVKDVPGCRLEILGDGPTRSDLEQRTAELGITENVRFHGYSADVPGFLRRIDAFVLSSVSEGLPLGVLESMAAALPIVATDVGGVRDLLEGGKCGWIVPASNAHELARAMRTAATTGSDHRNAMAASGRRHVQQYYSLERMTQEYEKLFQELMPKRGAASAA